MCIDLKLNFDRTFRISHPIPPTPMRKMISPLQKSQKSFPKIKSKVMLVVDDISLDCLPSQELLFLAPIKGY